MKNVHIGGRRKAATFPVHGSACAVPILYASARIGCAFKQAIGPAHRRFNKTWLIVAAALFLPAVAHAQVTFQEFTETKTGSNVTSITLTTPAGTVQDDLLIAAVVTDGNNSASLAPPGGEGWIQIDLNNQAGRVTFGVWYKLAGVSESPTHQWTWGAGEQSYA